jgi:hypothetical protein|tara:strand:- start:334 stop:705 length:372 start_codon:yes stop_codon:yes gene_type:complete
MSEKDKELEECKKLNMLLERWMEVDEGEAWDAPEWERRNELSKKLVERYLPLVEQLAQAGLLSFVFRTNRDRYEGLKEFISFQADGAYENGIIEITGYQHSGGSAKGSPAFDKLLADLDGGEG